MDPLCNLIMDSDLLENKYPQKLNNPGFKSLMSQVITPELFAKLKHLRTERGDWTIARTINTGVVNPDSVTGCHAGDEESYTLFAEFFDRVIDKRNKGEP